MAHIESIRAREVLDSRGNPTLEAMVKLDDGCASWAAVPSGASTGKHEATELRDQDSRRYGGKGVLGAIQNVNGRIAKALKGMNVSQQESLDMIMIKLDGTPNKEVLGANAILGVSLAIAKASALSAGIPLYQSLGRPTANLLPVPMLNILNGGQHAVGSTDIQEFMVVPAGFGRFDEALQCGVEVYHALKALLQKKGLSTNIGDEGGFAPTLNSNESAIEIITESIVAAGYTPGRHCFLALDVAASELYKEGYYLLEREHGRFTSDTLIELYEAWVSKYPIISIEDGLAEDDWEGWTKLTQKLGTRIQIVGDDLFTTNVSRIERGIQGNSANAVLIKFNQIGSLTETLAAVQSTKKAGWGVVISHRSGETEDTTIADLAVATDAGQIKTGAPARTDRIAKYNRLLRISDELGNQARYAGTKVYQNLDFP